MPLLMIPGNEGQPRNRIARVLVLVPALLLLILIGWVLHGVLEARRDPLRLAAVAAELAAQGEADAALRQFERALVYVRDDETRADILIRQADCLADLPPRPLAQAGRLYAARLAALRQAVEVAPTRIDAMNTLLDEFRAAAAYGSRPAEWTALADVAKSMANLRRRFRGKATPESADALLLKAAKYAAIGRLEAVAATAVEAQSSANLADLRREWLELALALPDDPEVAYFRAISGLELIRRLDEKEYRRALGNCVAEALEAVDSFAASHPADPAGLINRFRVRVRIERSLGIPTEPSAAALLAEGNLLDNLQDLPEESLRALARVYLTLLGTVVSPESAAFVRTVGETRKVVDAGLARKPGDPDWTLVNTRLELLRGRSSEARELLESVAGIENSRVCVEALQLTRLRSAALFELASLALDEAEAARREGTASVPDEVRDRVEALAAAESGDLSVRYLAGRLALLDGDPRRAARDLLPATQETGPVAVRAELFLGLALQQAGEPLAAAERLRHFLTLRHQRPEDRRAAAPALLLAAREAYAPEKGRPVADTMLSLYPDDPEIRILAAQTVLTESLYRSSTPILRDMALEKITDLLRDDAAAGRPTAEGLLACAQAWLGKDDSGHDVLRRYCAEHPDDNGAHLNLYRILLIRGKHEEAKQHLADRLARYRAAAPEVAAAIEQAQAGDTVLRRYIETLYTLLAQPDAFARHETLLRIRLSTGQRAEAENHLAAMRALREDDPRTWQSRISFALAFGETEEAQTLVGAAPAEALGEPDRSAALARIDLTANRPEAALPPLRRLTETWPLWSTGWALLGEALRLTDEPVKAEEAFSKALDLNPNEVTALEGLFRVCDAAKEPVKAIANLRAAARQATVLQPRMLESLLGYVSAKGYENEAMEIRTLLARIHPWDRNNRRELARILLRRGDLDGARRFVSELIDEEDSDLESLFVMADVVAAETGPEAMADYLAEAFSRLPNAPDTARIRYGVRLATQGFPAKAEEVLEQAVAQEGPEQANARLALANLLFDENRWGPALLHYRAAAETVPDRAIAYRIAECLLKLERYDEAAGTLAAARVDAPPDDATPLLLEAQAALLAKNAPGAEVAAREAVSREPQNPAGHLLLAKAILAAPAADTEKARQHLEKALELNDGLIDARIILADVLLAEQKTGRAVYHLAILTDALPNDAGLKLKLGRLYLETGELSSLRVKLARWTEIEPGRPEWLELHARLAGAEGRHADAARAFGRLFTASPSGPALAGWAQACLQDGKPEQAAEILDAPAAQPFAGELPIVVVRAVADARTGAAEAAATRLLRAFTSAAGDPTVTRMIVQTAMAELPVEGRAEWLNAILPTDSTHVAKLQLALLCTDAGDEERAATLLKELRRDIGDDHPLAVDMLLGLAEGSYRLRDFAAAEQDCGRVLRLRPEDPRVLNNLAQIKLDRAGDPYEAMRLADKAVSLSAGNPALLGYALDTLGQAQFAAQLHNQAEASFRRCVRYLDRSDVRLRLARVLLARGQAEAARVELRRAEELAHKENNADSLERIRKEFAGSR